MKCIIVAITEPGSVVRAGVSPNLSKELQERAFTGPQHITGIWKAIVLPLFSCLTTKISYNRVMRVEILRLVQIRKRKVGGEVLRCLFFFFYDETGWCSIILN